MQVGIPVQNLLRKADIDSAIKLCVIRGLKSYEDESSNWAADHLIRAFQMVTNDVEIADIYLTSYRVLRGVSNDPELANFSPDDQLPIVIEPIKRCDVLLLVTHETCGLPDSNIVRLIERISELYRMHKDDNKQVVDFISNKPFGVVATGRCGVSSAANKLGSVFNKYGLTLVRQGVAYCNEEVEEAIKSKEFGLKLEILARNLIDTHKALRS